MSAPNCFKPDGSAICNGCRNMHHQCTCDDPIDYEREADRCGLCGGDGTIDAHEDDPNYYEPGDTKPCPQCGGRG